MVFFKLEHSGIQDKTGEAGTTALGPGDGHITESVFHEASAPQRITGLSTDGFCTVTDMANLAMMADC
jgi:hypothetical protein